MQKVARRAVSVILATLLITGSAPQEAAAQVVRIAAGQGISAPVNPSVSVNAAPGAALTNTLGAASLNGSLAVPALAPSVVSPSLAVPSALAPAALPASAAPAFTFLPASAARAAASANDAPNPENAPEPAAAPAAPKASKSAAFLRRIGMPTFAKLLERKPAEAPVSAEDGAKLFDGAADKAAGETGPAVSGSESKASPSRLRAAVDRRIAESSAKRKATVDEFGGPLTSGPMTFRQRVAFGLKSGLNLVGIGAILKLTVAPLLAAFPWPQYFSDAALRGFGRVALLTNMGPNEIAAGLAENPLTFMGVTLPMAVAWEEISFRLLGFGAVFLVLAGLKPLTRWLSTMIAELPDAAGVVGVSKKLLKAGAWLSSLAFPIAAALSAYSFAAAHFAAWGVSPFVLILNAAAGVFLAHTAYKSRSITSPIVAHLIFNLVPIFTIYLAMTMSPAAGAIFAIIAGLLGVSSLFHTWLSARKERAWRMSNPGKALLVALLMFGGVSTLMYNPASHRAGAETVSATIRQIQEKKTETAPLPADTTKAAVPADTAATAAPVEAREVMIARVKPSVVNVLVRHAQGMGTGSGFILTPDGVFITNAHVVGSRQPGQFVEARIPGTPGVMKAKVLAVNHDKDLAIVQLQRRPDGKPWPTVKLASAAPLEGADVTAAGYPRGLPFTVTSGVLSGLDGRGNMYVKHLQTDASINPGNSGGPLFNAKGEVVGVNTQIYTQSGGSEGLGFAIMAPEVARVMEQFKATGNIATASIGIISNLSDPAKPEAGLEVEYVRHGSAAEKAGIQRGDLIISIGGEPIAEGGSEAAGHVAAVLSRHTPGQKISVVVLRGDSPVELSLTADAKVTRAGH